VYEVVLFSGGLDCLGGAVEEHIYAKKNTCLVCHRASHKHSSWQAALAGELGGHSGQNAFLVHVWCNKDEGLGKEFTQRTRSFLYASFAAVVARMFKLPRIRFYENGVTSINLPIAAQLVAGKASRTTHPRILLGFSKLFSLLFEEPFAIENPFLWLTKAEVVDRIRKAGCGGLIKHTVSCNHPRERTKLHTHCGECIQCVTRRFATLAGGASDAEDPEEMYAVDLFVGRRGSAESRTIAESYVRSARSLKAMSDERFFEEYGEVTRVLPYLGLSADDGASKILELHRRHAGEVSDVVTNGIESHAQDLNEGRLPETCLLVMGLPQKYRMPKGGEAEHSGAGGERAMDEHIPEVKRTGSESSIPFVATPFQRGILDALAHKALRTDDLAGEVGDRRRLFKNGGIKELMEQGLVAHHKRLGYYRPDAPPPELAPIGHQKGAK